MEQQDVSYFWKSIIMAIIIMAVMVLLIIIIVPGMRNQILNYKDLNDTIVQGEKDFTFSQSGIDVKFKAAYFFTLAPREIGFLSEADLKTKGYINDMMISKLKGPAAAYFIVLIDKVIDPIDLSKNELFTNDLVRSPVEITIPSYGDSGIVYWWNSKEWEQSTVYLQDGRWSLSHKGTGVYAVVVTEEHLVDIPDIDTSTAIA
ncbi:MAG: hypothetical protein KJ601_02520 [Nanoarchaeota archaeon]|nr:hypothetical protein [Nanoarchaeota archaeon]MBU1704172.1 hypothetical protein [Nanoarchaeota archaeon]